MRMPTTLRRATLLAAALAWAMPSAAAMVVLDDASQFHPSQTLISFDEGDVDGRRLQPFDPITLYRGVRFQSQGDGATGPQAAFDPVPPRHFGPGGMDGATVLVDLNFYRPGQGLLLTLPRLATQFGAEFWAVSPGDFSFTLFRGSELLETLTLAAGPVGHFYTVHAFQVDRPFDRVRIRGPGEFDGRVELDNLRFAPEPGSAALVAVALLGLGGCRGARAGRSPALGALRTR